MKICTYMVFILMLHACMNQQSKQISSINIAKVEVTDVFSDSTFFSQISALYWADNHVFLSDYKRSQILEIIPINKVVNTIGSQGRGPGELLGAGSLIVKNDTIYIVNEFQQRFEVFYKSKHIKSYQPNERINGTLRFSIINGNIIFSPIKNQFSMALLNATNDSIVYFGKLSELENRYSGRDIWTDTNYIYSISKTQPFIERYSLKGDFVDQYNYGEIDLIKRIMQFINNKQFAENTYALLIADSYLDENMLYLLVVNHDESKSSCNTILAIDIHEMKVVTLFVLNENDSWFNSFCIKDKILLAYDHKNASVIKFKML